MTSGAGMLSHASATCLVFRVWIKWGSVFGTVLTHERAPSDSFCRLHLHVGNDSHSPTASTGKVKQSKSTSFKALSDFVFRQNLRDSQLLKEIFSTLQH
jgi:hypothetical protein